MKVEKIHLLHAGEDFVWFFRVLSRWVHNGNTQNVIYRNSNIVTDFNITIAVAARRLFLFESFLVCAEFYFRDLGIAPRLLLKFQTFLAMTISLDVSLLIKEPESLGNCYWITLLMLQLSETTIASELLSSICSIVSNRHVFVLSFSIIGITFILYKNLFEEFESSNLKDIQSNKKIF